MSASRRYQNVSVAMPRELAAWVTGEAQRRGMSRGRFIQTLIEREKSGRIGERLDALLSPRRFAAAIAVIAYELSIARAHFEQIRREFELPAEPLSKNTTPEHP